MNAKGMERWNTINSIHSLHQKAKDVGVILIYGQKRRTDCSSLAFGLFRDKSERLWWNVSQKWKSISSLKISAKRKFILCVAWWFSSFSSWHKFWRNTCAIKTKNVSMKLNFIAIKNKCFWLSFPSLSFSFMALAMA
jgi:hypothetical protein